MNQSYTSIASNLMHPEPSDAFDDWVDEIDAAETKRKLALLIGDDEMHKQASYRLGQLVLAVAVEMAAGGTVVRQGGRTGRLDIDPDNPPDADNPPDDNLFENIDPPVAGNYSGGLTKVNVNDPDADALADRIGGQSSVRFDSDPNRREFDVVSDDYIGQAKPANFQGGSSFRNQAKATFEAAKETGRKVYYHFDGPPSQNVIDKLKEYSERYNVPVVIDTDPF